MDRQTGRTDHTDSSLHLGDAVLQLIVLVLGALLAIAGVALVSVPASLIVAGIGTATFALLWDFERTTK